MFWNSLYIMKDFKTYNFKDVYASKFYYYNTFGVVKLVVIGLDSMSKFTMTIARL